MYERFTDRARQIMQVAQAQAKLANSDFVRPIHVLLGIAFVENGVGASSLRNAGFDLEKLIARIRHLFTRNTEPLTKQDGKVPRHPDVELLLMQAMFEARQMNHNYVGSEHLLLAVIKQSYHEVDIILDHFGITSRMIRDKVLDLLGQIDPVRTEYFITGANLSPEEVGSVNEGLRQLFESLGLMERIQIEVSPHTT